MIYVAVDGVKEAAASSLCSHGSHIDRMFPGIYSIPTRLCSSTSSGHEWCVLAMNTDKFFQRALGSIISIMHSSFVSRNGLFKTVVEERRMAEFLCAVSI